MNPITTAAQALSGLLRAAEEGDLPMPSSVEALSFTPSFHPADEDYVRENTGGATLHFAELADLAAWASWLGEPIDDTCIKPPGTAFCVDQPMTLHPLVVIDLPDGALAGWPVLIHALKVAREKTGFRMIFDGLIDQIEAQTANPTPPKPDEPTGLGAVVRDDEGNTWVRHEPDNGKPGSQKWCWVRTGFVGAQARKLWSDVDAVEVLAAGWSE